MKKAAALSLAFVLLIGCSSEKSTNPPDVTEEVKEVVTNQETEKLSNEDFMELLVKYVEDAEKASVLLSNIVRYENSYYKSIKNLGGTFDSEKTVEAAREWLTEKTEYGEDKIDVDFVDITSQYKKFNEINLEDEKLFTLYDEYISKIYENYAALYSLATSPGDMANFVSNGNEYIDNINSNIKIMQALLNN